MSKFRRTDGGYDPLVIVSMLQKAIRRGRADLAGWAANELFRSGYERWMWRRLAEAPSRCERPDNVNAARHSRECSCVVQCNGNQHVIGHDRLIEELKHAMLRRLDRRYIPWKVRKSGAKVSARFAEEPPIPPITFAVVLVPFRFDRIGHMLKDARETRSCFILGETEEVDHHDASRRGSEIATVPIGSDMGIKEFRDPETQIPRLSRRHDETRSV